MHIDLRNPSHLKVISPQMLLDYLEANGWNEKSSYSEQYQLWVRFCGDEEYEVLVPNHTNFVDYALRISEAIHTLATFAGVSPERIYESLTCNR